MSLKTTEDQIYNNLKTNVGFEKSEKHLKFIREFGIPHHLFGSYSQSKKTTDYTAIPVTPEEHEYAEKYKSEFAIMKLPTLIRFLIKRIQHLEANQK